MGYTNHHHKWASRGGFIMTQQGSPLRINLMANLSTSKMVNHHGYLVRTMIIPDICAIIHTQAPIWVMNRLGLVGGRGFQKEMYSFNKLVM